MNDATTNSGWFERATKVIPGGVNSPVRSFSAVGGVPFTVTHGTGPWVFDVEGRRYLDLVQSYGAVLLGHAHPLVTEALQKAVARGTSFGMPTVGEVQLAEAICARVPGCEQVRLVSSGTEAVMTAIRLARGVTGRDRLVKFDGCYHGHSDGLLAGGGSGVATLGLPGSAGVPRGTVADTEVVPYNVVPEIGSEVACVIVEPVAANMNLVPPKPGFLAGLRRACDEAGALLIFDEVITGFRVGSGGVSTASGVTPDLWCFGKVIGGGLPVGAIGGRREVLSNLAPSGPVYQAGTLSGNPLATAAGKAVLDHVGDGDYARLSAAAATFGRDLETSIGAAGLPARVSCFGPLVGLLIGSPGRDVAEPVDYETVRSVTRADAYRTFFHAMLRRGVVLPPGPYEVLFPGFAHGPDELALVVSAAGEAAAEVVAGWSGAPPPGR